MPAEFAIQFVILFCQLSPKVALRPFWPFSISQLNLGLFPLWRGQAHPLPMYSCCRDCSCPEA